MTIKRVYRQIRTYFWASLLIGSLSSQQVTFTMDKQPAASALKSKELDAVGFCRGMCSITSVTAACLVYTSARTYMAAMDRPGLLGKLDCNTALATGVIGVSAVLIAIVVPMILDDYDAKSKPKADHKSKPDDETCQRVHACLALIKKRL